MRWLTRPLADDHASGAVRDNVLIGYVLAPGSLPRLVACFPEGRLFEERACLNEVAADRAALGVAGNHLTRTTVLDITPDQLRTLHETGEVRVGVSVVRLFPAVG